MTETPPKPEDRKILHVFLASPGDVAAEREFVRKFFEQYNKETAATTGLQYDVIDWENFSSAGIGRPQELISEQTLKRFKDSLVLVVGIMGHRFGTPTGKSESGTLEELEWALEHKATKGRPEIKLFFKTPDNATALTPEQVEERGKISAFKNSLRGTAYWRDFKDGAFEEVFRRDLGIWLNARARPWKKSKFRFSDAALCAFALVLSLGLWSLIFHFNRRPKEAAWELHLGRSMNPYAVALSPDGKHVAFVAANVTNGRSLFVASYDNRTPTRILGTENANYPFWSSDGTEIGFFADCRIKLVGRDSTSVPVSLPYVAAAPAPRGGTRNAAGVVIFSPGVSHSLQRTGISGGGVVSQTHLDAHERSHRFPFFLGDGQNFIYLSKARRSEDDAIMLGSLSRTEVRRLFQNQSQAAYSGEWMFYESEGALRKRRFDLTSGQWANNSNAETIAPSVGTYLNVESYFSVSTNSRVAYHEFGASREIRYLDFKGNLIRHIRAGTKPNRIALDRRAERLAWYDEEIGSERRAGILIADFNGNNPQRVKHSRTNGFEGSPLWNNQSDSLFYVWKSSDGPYEVFEQNILNGTERGPIYSTTNQVQTSSLSPDGKTLYLEEVPAHGQADIIAINLDARSATPIFQSPDWETTPRQSPNGRWLLFARNDVRCSDDFQIFVVAFGSTDVPRPIVNGIRPEWSPHGDRIFFWTDGGTCLRVLEVNESDATAKGDSIVIHRLEYYPQDQFETWYSVSQDKILVQVLVPTSTNRTIFVKPF